VTEHSLDDIDDIVEFWRTENPDLDVDTKRLALRLRRGALLLERALRQDLTPSGVEEFWEIEMLLSLRHAPDNRRSAGELMRESRVTSGAITNRIDRLEKRGWVLRESDPRDRRQVLVSLTPTGFEQANHVIALKNRTEERLFGSVDRTVIQRLNDDLRAVIESMEQQDEPISPAT
jgi:DNA-binding MarR family transcriptional regulator